MTNARPVMRPIIRPVIQDRVMSNADPFANVVFLADFDGADAATEATDYSNSNHAITFNGDAKLTAAAPQLFNESLRLDGTGDSVEAADHEDWHFGAGEFTAECRVRFSSLAGDSALIGQWNPGANDRSWLLWKDNGNNLLFSFSTTGTNAFSSTALWAGVSISTWYALAVDRDSSGQMRVYIEGAMHSDNITEPATLHNSGAVMRIGDQVGGGKDSFARIDEVRITKGLARYASDDGYTVATEAFPKS